MKKYKIEKIKMAQINEDQIPDDVLERIDGYEEFVDKDIDLSDKIYSVSKLNDILTDEDDDTNETTKCRIEELYEQIKNFNYLQVVKF